MSVRNRFDEEHLITVGDSRVWVGEVRGEGPAILLLHGFPDDSSIYDKLLPLLQGRRVLALDFGGYGLSPRDDTAWTLKKPDAEVAGVLDALGIRGATVVGHDASLAVAVHVALDRPELVGKLILLNGYFHSDPELRLPDMIRLFGTRELTVLSDAIMDDPQQRGWILGLSGGQFGIDATAPGNVAMHSILPQYFGSEEHEDARAAIRGWTATLYAGLNENDRLEKSGALADIEASVVLAFGSGDPYLTNVIAAHIGELLGADSVESIADASHWPQWDQPEAVAEIILRA